MKFGIVSDSSCDLNAEYTQREQVSVVSFYVSFDGEHYLKEREAGKREVKQSTALNMHQKGYQDEVIAEVLEVDVETVQEWISELESATK